MRKYLLDNGPLVALLKARPGAERIIRPWVTAGEAATSIIVYGEAIEYFKGERRLSEASGRAAVAATGGEAVRSHLLHP